jgi:hypothetical protein
MKLSSLNLDYSALVEVLHLLEPSVPKTRQFLLTISKTVEISTSKVLYHSHHMKIQRLATCWVVISKVKVSSMKVYHPYMVLLETLQQQTILIFLQRATTIINLIVWQLDQERLY